MIPLNDLGPGEYILTSQTYGNFMVFKKTSEVIFSHSCHLFSEAYSTLDQRERRHTLDETTDTLPVLFKNNLTAIHTLLI